MSTSTVRHHALGTGHVISFLHIKIPVSIIYRIYAQITMLECKRFYGNARFTISGPKTNLAPGSRVEEPQAQSRPWASRRCRRKTRGKEDQGMSRSSTHQKCRISNAQFQMTKDLYKVGEYQPLLNPCRLLRGPRAGCPCHGTPALRMRNPIHRQRRFAVPG